MTRDGISPRASTGKAATAFDSLPQAESSGSTNRISQALGMTSS